MPITSLEQLSLLSLKEQIDTKKITLKKLEPCINSNLFDTLNEMLINDSINKFQETTFKFLKGELIVKTAQNIEVDEDMVLLYDEITDTNDREYVRNVYITPQYSHIEKENYDEEFNTLEYKEYIDDEWKYIYPFVHNLDT
jgi:hypothetical protein